MWFVDTQCEFCTLVITIEQGHLAIVNKFVSATTLTLNSCIYKSLMCCYSFSYYNNTLATILSMCKLTK